MKERYKRLFPHEVELVDLCVFERSLAVNAFLAAESDRVEVASHTLLASSFQPPRRLERISPHSCLPRKDEKATILHGNPIYCMFPVPTVLRNLARRFRLSRSYVADMFYLISIAVIYTVDCSEIP